MDPEQIKELRQRVSDGKASSLEMIEALDAYLNDKAYIGMLRRQWNRANDLLAKFLTARKEGAREYTFDFGDNAERRIKSFPTLRDAMSDAEYFPEPYAFFKRRVTEWKEVDGESDTDDGPEEDPGPQPTPL